MRKLLILLVVLTMVLVGCSSSDEEPNVKEVDSVSNPGSESPSTDSEDDNENEVVETPPASAPSEAKIEQKVIFESNDIIVTVNEINYDGLFGPELSLLIENNSDKNITVQARNVSINGIMVDPLLSTDVASMKKANDSLTFMRSELDEASITTIKDIELSLKVVDTDTYEDIAMTEPILLQTDAVDYVQTYDDSGEVAYDANGVKIVAKKLDSEDSIFGADLYMYIENNSERDITVQVRDVSINGFMVTGYFSAEVGKGKKSFDSITFLDSDLTENNITDFESIELYFEISDSNTYETIVETDIVSITFK